MADKKKHLRSKAGSRGIDLAVSTLVGSGGLPEKFLKAVKILPPITKKATGGMADYIKDLIK